MLLDPKDLGPRYEKLAGELVDLLSRIRENERAVEQVKSDCRGSPSGCAGQHTGGM
jgi:hypothetical protein